MLKKLCIGLGVGALALAGGVTSIPVAHSQGANRETLRAFTRDGQTRETDIDADNSGRQSAGDYFIGRAPLIHDGRKVGREDHRCDILQAGRRFARVRCSGTFHFNGRGNIEISGVATFSRRSSGGGGFSILGGTTDFRDAGGRATVKGTHNGTIFTFRVIHN